MRHTILDVYVSNEDGSTVRHITIADFPLRGAAVSTSREGAINMALSEIEWILQDLPTGHLVRLFDMFTLDYMDFVK